MALVKTKLAMNQAQFEYFADADGFVQGAAISILNAAQSAISESGIFRIVLSGGETPRRIYNALAEYDGSISFWKAWEIWFADERCLPANDCQRNSRMAEDIWLRKVPINRDKVYVIQAELDATKAAKLYHEALISVNSFDLTLLGIGTDGHTASLFPGSATLTQTDQTANALPVYDAPKEPAERVTLSVSRLNKSKQVIFMAAGEEKKNIINDYMSGVFMPASLIRGITNTSFFYTQAKLQ
jgi:6-phosphogluconolactonase